MDGIDISRASELYCSKDYAGFMKYCLSFDKIEDGDTLDSMGICYRDGKGVTKNTEKSMECFEQAVTFGYAQSANRIGVFFRDSDLEKAIYWYKIAADNGVSDSMYNLAKIYRYEDAVKDINKAIGWYEKAAEKGDADAMYALGRYYKYEAKPIDLELSTMWYEEAANRFKNISAGLSKEDEAYVKNVTKIGKVISAFNKDATGFSDNGANVTEEQFITFHIQ